MWRAKALRTKEKRLVNFAEKHFKLKVIVTQKRKDRDCIKQNEETSHDF